MKKQYFYSLYALCMPFFLYSCEPEKSSEESTPRPKILLPKSPRDTSAIQASTLATDIIHSPRNYFEPQPRVIGVCYIQAFLYPSLGLAETIEKTYSTVPFRFLEKEPILFCSKKITLKKSTEILTQGIYIKKLHAFIGSDKKEYPISNDGSSQEDLYIQVPNFVDGSFEPKPLTK